jgi:hypothetical protein
MDDVGPMLNPAWGVDGMKCIFRLNWIAISSKQFAVAIWWAYLAKFIARHVGAWKIYR